MRLWLVLLGQVWVEQSSESQGPATVRNYSTYVNKNTNISLNRSRARKRNNQFRSKGQYVEDIKHCQTFPVKIYCFEKIKVTINPM